MAKPQRSTAAAPEASRPAAPESAAPQTTPAAAAPVAPPEPCDLLARLSRLALAHEGKDHVQHEAVVSLSERLAALKHHLARVDGLKFDADVDAGLAAIARLL